MERDDYFKWQLLKHIILSHRCKKTLHKVTRDKNRHHPKWEQELPACDKVVTMMDINKVTTTIILMWVARLYILNLRLLRLSLSISRGGPPVACYDSQKGKNSKNHVHLELEHLVQKYEVWTFGGGAICAGKLCRHSNCLRAAIFRINGRADHY